MLSSFICRLTPENNKNQQACLHLPCLCQRLGKGVLHEWLGQWGMPPSSACVGEDTDHCTLRISFMKPGRVSSFSKCRRGKLCTTIGTASFLPFWKSERCHWTHPPFALVARKLGVHLTPTVLITKALMQPHLVLFPLAWSSCSDFYFSCS